MKGLDTYLVTVTDHGMNASTFTARVIASTDSDMVSAVTGGDRRAQGAAARRRARPGARHDRGDRHADRAEAWMKDAIAERQAADGLRPPRLQGARPARRGAVPGGRASWPTRPASARRSNWRRRSSGPACRCWPSAKPGRNLNTNVEFYTALLLRDVGLSARPVLADLRGRPHGRLDRARHGAAGRRAA